MSSEATCELVRQVLQLEARAVLDLVGRVDERASHAIDLLLNCKGRVIATGMGKMGCVARKAAATLASTGTPAFFLQPSEALHGDLGIVTGNDVLLVLSNSGETEEIVRLLPYVQRSSIPVIALTGSPQSTLAKSATVVVDIGVTSEADADCPAPTSSTTAAMAMCDALAVALMRRRGLTRDQFAIFHPGGQLGRKLLLTVGELMKTGDRLPLADPSLNLRQAIVVMSRGGLGAVLVTDSSQRLAGIFTDGDLRRVFESNANPLDFSLNQVMTRTPHAAGAAELAASALRMMEKHAITLLPVVDDQRRVIGAIHLHDLLQAQLA